MSTTVTTPGPAPFASPPAPERTVAMVRPTAILGAVVSPKTWRATVHVVLDFWVGVFVFAFLVAGVATTAALLVTIVFGLVALALTLLGIRLIGRFERARFDAVLGVHIANPHRPTEGSVWVKLRRQVLSAATWKEVAYAVVLFPLAVIGFSLVVGMWSMSLALTALPAVIHAFPDETAHFGLFDVSAGGGTWLLGVIGLLCLLFIAPWCARGWAALDIVIGRNLLGTDPEAEIEVLEERVDTLEATRAWALDVAEAERRRIERDLHDGAQQRLVALAMDLGMAREKLDTDPEAARTLVEHAHEEAKRAITELRDLARGIHPVALGDRGLPGAIPAIAKRSAVPVDVTVNVPFRPSPSIEGMAYFIVSECLTNTAKHAAASRIRVLVQQYDDRLVIEVMDDGRGGAHAVDGSGTGLRGLIERAASVDGTFTIDSPVGGPTLIRAELPCES